MMLIERMRTKLVRCGAVIATIATGLATMPAEPAEVRSETGAPDAILALVGGRFVDGYGGHPLDHAVILVSGDRIGTVSEGKLADLIIVDGDPLQDLSLLQHAIVVVISDGRVHFPDHNFPKDDFPRQPQSNRN